MNEPYKVFPVTGSVAMIRLFGPYGYVVYRDDAPEGVATMLCAAVHRVAAFVTQQEADQYAQFRNAATHHYHTTAPEVVTYEFKQLGTPQ